MLKDDRPPRISSGGEAGRRAGLGGTVAIALFAFLLPAILFAAILISINAWESGQSALRRAMEDADTTIDRTDAELQLNLRSLIAIAGRVSGAPITQPRPAPGTAAYNAELFPHWRGSLVWSRHTGQTLFSSLPGEDLPAARPEWLAPDASGPVIGGIETLAGAPSVLVHVPVPDDPRMLVVTTAIYPEAFQEILMRRARPPGISAIVDRSGNFIARSEDFDARVGTPATNFVREAVQRGGAGDYRGTTYEGLENYTAYFTSDLSGWSAHFAISHTLVDAPLPWAVWVAVIGGVLSLMLAAGLVWLMHRDLQRRQQAERSLSMARRVETLGRLTGGIAHDFNNLLTVMMGSLERGRKRSADPAVTREIDMALEAARRAAALTRSLLQYSREKAVDREVLDVNACVREAAEVIKRTIGASYDIQLQLDPEAGAASAHGAQLASALLNLAINARDAMPDGGVIVLATTTHTAARSERRWGLPAGDYVVVSVADNGPGMPARVAQRAFDPFYTTKDVGKGTGLGLAQVDAFARQSGGLAELETAPGKGVRVSITLPSAGTVAPIPADAPTHVLPAGLNVLVVEDEPGVREHACALLHELGCTFAQCGDAANAMKALAEARFDIVFSDIVLPGGKSGVAIAEQVQRQYPGTAVLLATGYAGEELAGREGRWPVLSKPYGIADLSSALASALASRRAEQVQPPIA